MKFMQVKMQKHLDFRCFFLLYMLSFFEIMRGNSLKKFLAFKTSFERNSLVCFYVVLYYYSNPFLVLSKCAIKIYKPKMNFIYSYYENVRITVETFLLLSVSNCNVFLIFYVFRQKMVNNVWGFNNHATSFLF